MFLFASPLIKKLIYSNNNLSIMPILESFSGVRGVYDDGLDEQVAIRYSYAYLSFLNERYGDKIKVILGTDTRPSKEILKEAVIEALDCEIIDLGIASTPMVEFAVRHYKATGGIIITASHNEPYWNGFKFLDEKGSVLSEKDMAEVIKTYTKIKKLGTSQFLKRHLYKNRDPKKNNLKKVFKKYEEINKRYSEYILDFLTTKDKNTIRNSKLKVILDPNGGTGIIAKQILESIGVKVKAINTEYGIFNRTIEPNEDSLFYLENPIREKNYDFAAGFDCDADRVEIMTKKGLVSGNHLLALITDEILSKAQNKTIVVNNATSSMVKQIAEKHKAKYVETEVGEINVVEKLYQLKAPIGGEGSSSGVIIPPSRCRDGILTLVYLLKIIAVKGKKLEELIEDLPTYYNLKRKIKLNPKKYAKLKDRVKRQYNGKNHQIQSTLSESLKIIVDSNSFVWFRMSKTEADVLRVIVDSPKKEKAETLMSEALALVKK